MKMSLHRSAKWEPTVRIVTFDAALTCLIVVTSLIFLRKGTKNKEIKAAN